MESDGHSVKRIWGQANPCPACGGRGHLDRIDLVDRVEYEHCEQCGATYMDRERDLSLPYAD